MIRLNLPSSFFATRTNYSIHNRTQEESTLSKAQHFQSRWGGSPLAQHTMGYAFYHWAGVPQPKNHGWSMGNNFDRDFGRNDEGKWAILGPPRVHREWNDCELIETAVNEMAAQPLHT
jgi:hypothetical protein